MSAAHDGGPAFPKAGLDPWNQAQTVQTGMTLRDYFAAKAMAGLIAADVEFSMSRAVIAKLAMQQADAMLEARK